MKQEPEQKENDMFPQVQSDIVLLPIHDNELVTAFLGDGALSLPHYRDDARAVRELGSGSAHFDETFHWHTGKPLEDSYWQEASKDYTKLHVSDTGMTEQRKV